MKKVKCLILSPLYYPERHGGIEKVVYEYTRRLSHYNIEPIIVCSKSSLPIPNAIYSFYCSKVSGTTVWKIELPVDFKSMDYFEYEKVNKEVTTFIRSHVNYDLIWCHDWYFGMSALELQEETGKPLINQLHVLKCEESKGRMDSWRSWIDLIQRALSRSSDLNFAPTQKQISLIKHHMDLQTNDLIHLPYGIDNPTIPEKLIETKSLRLLYYGRFEKEKNIQVILNGLKDLINNKFELVLVGSGSLEKDIIELIKKNKLENKVSLIPFTKNREELEEYIQSADLILFPSLYEACGLVLLEAAAHKKPVLYTSQATGEEFFTDNVSGLCFDGHNAQSFNNKIQWALDNVSKLKKMGRNAFHEISNKYCWDRSSQIASIYIHSLV